MVLLLVVLALPVLCQSPYCWTYDGRLPRGVGRWQAVRTLEAQLPAATAATATAVAAFATR